MRTPGERTSGAWTGGCVIHPDGGDETDRTAGNSYTATPHNTQGANSGQVLLQPYGEPVTDCRAQPSLESNINSSGSQVLNKRICKKEVSKMQRYQTEDEHRKAMRAKINRTIKRGRRRKRIIRRLKKAVPGICIGTLMVIGAGWVIAAPLPDPTTYEYRFQAENGQWYTPDEYDQMCRERDAYHKREQEEAQKLHDQVVAYQEQYQKDQEAEWELYQSQTRQGLIQSMDFDANDAYLLEKIAMAEAESEDTEGKALVMLVVLNRVWDTRFPDTIEEVIMQDGAFTPVSNGRFDSVEPDADCQRALEMITTGHWDESDGALYFERTEGQSTWHSRNLTKLFEHGAHTFYTEKE